MAGDASGSGHRRPDGTTILVAIAAGVVGGALVAGAVALFGDDDASTSPEASTCQVTGVADRVLPSVVTLHVSGPQGAGTGSGVAVETPLPGGDDAAATDHRVYLLTNEHVIAPGGTIGEVQITYADGATHRGTVVGADPLTDLAVVRDDEGDEDATPVKVGEAGSLRVGQGVVALGAPLGLSSRSRRSRRRSPARTACRRDCSSMRSSPAVRRRPRASSPATSSRRSTGAPCALRTI